MQYPKTMFPSPEFPPALGRASIVSIAMASIAGVAFLTVVIASWEGPEALRVIAWGAAGILGCFIGVLLLKRVVGWFGRKELFSPLIAFPIAYTVWFALGSLTLFDDKNAKVLQYSGIGLACYLAGVLLAGWRSALRPPRPVACNEWEDSRFWRIVGLLVGATLISYVYIVSRVGIIALDPQAAERRMDIGKYGPLEAVLFTASWTILVFVAAHLWTRSQRPAIRTLAWLGLGVAAVILLSLGSRGYLFVPVLTAVVARHYLRKRFHVVKLAFLGLAIFMALSFYGYSRDATLSQGSFSLRGGSATQLAVFPAIYAYLYVRQPVETLQEVIRVIPLTIPYQNGFLTFGALRTLLPGHHEMSDMFFKQILGSDFVGGGQPATLLGPLYADFGPLGIVLGMFVVGVVVAVTHSWMLANPTVLRVLIYSWLMQTVLFSLFGALIPYITTLWIPLFWWVLDVALLRRPAFALKTLPTSRVAQFNT
jgi:oligosaccharide repeat unit polymerase